jgi:hypothetical protein
VAKEKPITVNTIYALSGKVVKTETLMRQIFQGSVVINGVYCSVKKDGENYTIEIIDDVPEPYEFMEGGSLYPVKTLEETDPELHRLLGWYCSERKDILETLELRYIMIDANKGEILAIPIPTRETRVHG